MKRYRKYLCTLMSVIVAGSFLVAGFSCYVFSAEPMRTITDQFYHYPLTAEEAQLILAHKPPK